MTVHRAIQRLSFIAFPVAVLSVACANGGPLDSNPFGFDSGTGGNGSSSGSTAVDDSGGSSGSASASSGSSSSGSESFDSGDEPSDFDSGDDDAFDGNVGPSSSGSSSSSSSSGGGGSLQSSCSSSKNNTCGIEGILNTDDCISCCQSDCSDGSTNYFQYLAACLCGSSGPCATACAGSGDYCSSPGNIATKTCSNCVDQYASTGATCDPTSGSIASSCNGDVNCSAYVSCVSNECE